MIVLPDRRDAFSYENNFYLTCDNSRIAKFIAQYELFRMSQDIQGDIVECGVFKGASLIRLIHYREIFGLTKEKKVLGFDTFGEFPDSTYAPDNELLGKFLDSAGSQSISKEQLDQVLKDKGVNYNINLIEGDVKTTIPEFLEQNKGFRISLLNLDVDLYEPSLSILENLFPLISRGGILMLDDYEKFPGETKAVDDYLGDKRKNIRKFNYVKSPCFYIKEE
jgi:hypothetical protein